MKADFSGYASKSGLKCSDGRTIMAHAFKGNDKQRVPLVWMHQHDGPDNILGHAILENREDGVYTYGFFNDSEKGRTAKLLVEHGDIESLSIYANNLVQDNSKNVKHGVIREVSLVVAGANPGAQIDNLNLQHGDGSIEPIESEAIIYQDSEVLEHADLPAELEREELEHADGETQSGTENTNDKSGDTVADETDTKETVADVFETLNEKQKKAVYILLGGIADGSAEDTEDDADDLEQADSTNDNDDNSLKHQEGNDMGGRNVFSNGTDGGGTERNTLTHAQVNQIVKDGVKMGSFKESFLAHAGEYGITNIDLMFPDAKNLTSTPELLARQADWVPKVLGGVKQVPYARIKSFVADLTAEEARAKGYIKGKMKKEEVILLLRRTTAPTTVYKKQKLDRDDILDITDFDIIAWLKWEIRFMLNEELARAILIGDGRSAISEDHIKDPKGVNDGTGIRSILHDHSMYAHTVFLPANTSAADRIDAVSEARTEYRGSGTPVFFTTDKHLTQLLLLKDKMGRRLYDTEEALASALRVKEIIPVEPFEDVQDLFGIVVNLIDYSVGTDRGGEVSFFEDFDIDFNQNKYLMEYRGSGALTKPKSALVIRLLTGELATTQSPSYNGATNTITIPAKTGVDYLIDDEVVTGSVVITNDTEVTAEPKDGFYFEPGTTTLWTYDYTATTV
jgi:hypothetical protein